MERDIARMVEATGASMPLAARIVSLVLDSGASQQEVFTALSLVHTLLGRLPITFDHQISDKQALAELDGPSL